RRVDLEFTGEVYAFPAAILAVEEEAQRRPGVLFPARIVSLVQQPAVLGYFIIVEKLLGQGLCLEGQVLRLGIRQRIAAANVIEHSHGKPPLRAPSAATARPVSARRSRRRLRRSTP